MDVDALLGPPPEEEAPRRAGRPLPPVTGIRTNASGVPVPMMAMERDAEWNEQGEQPDEEPAPAPRLSKPRVSKVSADNDVAPVGAGEEGETAMVQMEVAPSEAVNEPTTAPVEEEQPTSPRPLPMLPQGAMPPASDETAPQEAEQPMEIIMPAPPPAVILPPGASSPEEAHLAALDAEVAALSGATGAAPAGNADDTVPMPYRVSAAGKGSGAADVDSCSIRDTLMDTDPELRRLEQEAAAAAAAAEVARVAAEQARKAAQDARQMAETRRAEPVTFVPIMPLDNAVMTDLETQQPEDVSVSDAQDMAVAAPAAAAEEPGTESQLPVAPGSPADYSSETPTFAVSSSMVSNLSAAVDDLPLVPKPKQPLPAMAFATPTPASSAVVVAPPRPGAADAGSRMLMIRFGAVNGGEDDEDAGQASMGSTAQAAAAQLPVVPLGCTEYALAQLPDGRVVTSGKGLLAHVWDVNSGKAALQLMGHTQRVWCVSAAAATSHNVILTGSWDATIRVWNAAKGVCQATWSGHTDKVWALTLLPGSSLCVSASWDGTCRVWDLDTVEPHVSPGSPRPERHPRVGAPPLIAICSKHEGAVLSMAALDSTRFASGGADGCVRLWYAVDGTCLAQLEGHTGPVCALAFLPLSQLLVSGGHDCTIRVWDVPAGASGDGIRKAPVRVLTNHSDVITCVIALPDGRVASGGADGAIWLWSVDPDAPMSAPPACLKGHKGAVTALALVSDTLLASGDTEHQLLHWDLSRAEGAQLVRMQHTTSTGASSAWMTNSSAQTPSFVAAVAAPGAPSSGRWAFTIPKSSTGIASMKADTSAALDGSLRLKFLPPPHEEQPKPSRAGSPVRGRASPPPKSPAPLAITASEQQGGAEEAPVEKVNSVHTVITLTDGRVAVTAADEDICVFTPATGALSCTLRGHTARVWCLAEMVQPDGEQSGGRANIRVASGSWDGTIRLWQMLVGGDGDGSATCTAVLEGHTDRVWTLTVLNPRTLVSGSWDGLLRVWDVTDPFQPACVHVLCPTPSISGDEDSAEATPCRIWCAAALGHEHLVCGSADGSQSVWNAITGDCVHTLSAGAAAGGHVGPVSALAALGGGRHVSGGWDGTVRVWHAQKGVCERILAHEPRSKVTALAPLGMGRIAVSTSDGIIRVWDAPKGQLMHVLSDHTPGWVTYLAATPDGHLVSGGADNCVRVWDPLVGRCVRCVPALEETHVPCFAPRGAAGRLTTGRCCFTLPPGETAVVEVTDFV